jgi:chromosome segregation ATPase
MKFMEPTFDAGGELWPALSNQPHKDTGPLEDTIARQSSELNLRLTEVLELYNVQSRQADALEMSSEEIHRLKQTVSALQEITTQQKSDAAAAQDKILLLENEKAALRSELDRVLQDSKTLEDRIFAMQAAFNTSATNVTSALEQIEYLNSELATGAAERFKLVATVHGEKRRHNQQISICENRVEKAEARTEIQEAQIKHLDTVRTQLDKRIQVLETLLRSERDVAERKIERLANELRQRRSDPSLARLTPATSQFPALGAMMT